MPSPLVIDRDAIVLQWAPLPGTAQVDFLNSTAPAPAFMGPAQIGKTGTGAAKVISDALTHPGAHYVIVSPSYRAHTIKTALPKYLALLPKGTLVPTAAGEPYHTTEQRILLFNGAMLHFSSAEEGDNYYGPSVRITHLDEAGLFEDAAIFDVAAARSDQIIATFTPKKDRSHWTYDIWGRQYEKALEALHEGKPGICEHPLYPVFTMRMEDNPAIPRRRLQLIRQRAEYSWLARREYTGEYLNIAGPVYDSFDPHTHVRPHSGLLRPVTGGVDLGTTAATCIVVAGRTESGRIHVRREFWQERCGETELIMAIRELERAYPGIHFYVDPGDAGRTQIERLRRLGVRAHVADNSVHNRVTTIWELLAKDGSGAPGLTIDPGCTHVIEQFTNWRWRRGKTPGDSILWTDVEPHAHAADAAGYAILGLTRQLNTVPILVRWGRRSNGY